MNLSWPNRAAGKAKRRSAARVWTFGATAVAAAGAIALAAPAFSANASISTAHTVKHATTTTMSGVSGYVGSRITLAAKVKGSTPKGTVRFIWGHTTLCSASVSHGIARCGHVFGGVGSLRVQARYLGNSTHKASSAVATVKVLALHTSVKVTPSTANAQTNAAVTFSAVVSPSNATGTITFSVNGTKLSAVRVVRGRASLNHAWNAAGSYTVTAAYGGDAKHLRSSSSTKVTVTAPAPAAYGTTSAITITGDAYSPTLNWETAGPVTVPFTVTNNTAGGPAPTGTVTISDPPDIPDQPANPSFTGCTGNLTPVLGTNYSKGSCQVATPTLAWGFVLMRATYNPSSGTFTTSNTGDTEYKILNLMPTGTAVTTTAATAGTVNVSADVYPVAPALPPDNLLAAFSEQIETGPPGDTGDTVAFTVKDGNTVVGSCAASALQAPDATDTNNFATCGVTLADGTYTVVATFSGDEYAATSTSPALTLTVTG